MNEKIIEVEYSVTEAEAESAFKLSGNEKDRISKNRNTTIWFAVIMLLFGYSIFTRLSKNGWNFADGIVITYLGFEVLSAILIVVTWFGGGKVKKDAVSATKNIKYRVFINPNGISVSADGADEDVLERGNFAVAENENIFLVTVSGGSKLVIPKRSFEGDDLKLAKDYFFGRKSEQNGDNL